MKKYKRRHDKMKRTISLIAALAMLMSCLPNPAIAQGYEIKTSSDTYVVTAPYDGTLLKNVNIDVGERVELLPEFKNIMQITKENTENDSAVLAATGINGNTLPQLYVYTAEYSSGILQSVSEEKFEPDENGISNVEVKRPNNENYKIFIWTDNMEPVTDAITSDSNFFSVNNTDVPTELPSKQPTIQPSASPSVKPDPSSVPTATAENDEGDKPQKLKTDGLEEPIGIDSSEPKFSWRLYSDESGVLQSAYHIIAASSIDKLNEEDADMWNSGIVESAKQSSILYGGKTPESLKKYYWKVKVYDNKGHESEWSDAASFETAFLNNDEWSGVKLVGGQNVKEVRSVINIPSNKKIESARAYVSSPGYFELHVNGYTIGDHVIDPVQTNPDMRLMYPTFDVTEYITNGDNAVGAMLGYGGVCGATDLRENDIRCLAMQLIVRYDDGSSDRFVTDNSWKCTTDGPVLYDNLYYGETYDATKEIVGWDTINFDDSGWDGADVFDLQNRTMSAELVPIKASEKIKPISETNLGNNTYVYDLGENIAGRPIITVKGTAGETVEMYFGEILNKNGSVNPTTTKNNWTCKYTLGGEGEEVYSPRFSISGFRYIQVSGNVEVVDVKGELITADIRSTSAFTSSNNLLNKIHDMYLLSQKANISTGIPIDCPHRERLGWLGDAMLISDALSYNFDSSNMMDKWFNDMDDEVKRSPGIWRNFIPYPSNWSTSDFDVPWFSANIQIPWDVYMAYGDKTVLESNYARMKNLVDDLTKNYTTDYLINTNGAWQDWVSPLGKGNLTPTYLGSGYYYHCVELLSEIAEILNKNDDKSAYEELAEHIKNAINNKWLMYGEYYDSNTQSANAMALDFGIVPKENEAAVLNSLISDLEKRNYHITTGVTGTYNIFNALSKYGRDDLLYRFMTSETYPSYGYMLANGSTTPWEFWGYSTGSMNSWNHVFLSGPGETWLNRSVAGIKQITAGYDEFEIRPTIVGDLTGAAGSYNSVHGSIESSWERNGYTVSLSVSVPVNSTGYIYVPTLGADDNQMVITVNNSTLREHGIQFETDNISYVKTEDNYVVFKVGSGKYEFIMNADDDADISNSAIHKDTVNVSDAEKTTISAAQFAELSGVSLNKNWYVNSLDPGDYIFVGNVDMSNVSDIQASLWANWGEGTREIDFRIDSPNGEIVSSLYVLGTQESKASISHIEESQCTKVSGEHKLYMTFRGASDICNLEYINLIRCAGTGYVTGTEAVTVYAPQYGKAELPQSVTAYLSDNTAEKRKVSWEQYSTAAVGTYKINGSVDGSDDIRAELNLVVTDRPYITEVEDLTIDSYVRHLNLPMMVTAAYSDGNKKQVFVDWKIIDKAEYSTAGEITVTGMVKEYAGEVKANITLKPISNDNILADADFETLSEFINGGWKPVSGAWRSGLGTSATIDKDNVSPNNNSTKSAKINNAAIQQVVALENGEAYSLSFDVYILSSCDTSNITFGIHGYSGVYENGMVYGYSGGTKVGNPDIVFDDTKKDQWQTVTVSFIPSAEAQYVVQLACYNNEMYIDNTSLKLDQN